MEEYGIAKSSFISGATYDRNLGTLVLKLVSGKIYTYYNVPKDVWEAFKNSESKGNFFSSFIKGRYRE